LLYDVVYLRNQAYIVDPRGVGAAEARGNMSRGGAGLDHRCSERRPWPASAASALPLAAWKRAPPHCALAVSRPLSGRVREMGSFSGKMFFPRVRAYSNGAVQPILCSPKSRMCSPSCKIVQSKICALNFHINQQQELFSHLAAASAAVAGGSWKLVYPTNAKGVSYS